MVKKKKIAFIIQHLTNGGAERTISNLSLLLENEYDISIIVFDGKNITYPYGGKIIDLSLPPMNGMINKVLTTIKRIKKVKAIKKKMNFETSISFMFGANIVNVMSRNNEKVITSARNYMSAYGVNWKSKIREQFIAKKSDIEIALSRMVEYDLNNNFKIKEEKTKTIYNPCDVKKIKMLSREKTDFVFDKKKFYYITAGRMVKQKGQWHLIKAFSKIRNTHKDCELIILGTGELDDELKKLAKIYNLEDCIHFMGFVDNPYKYISKSSCFVLSSLFEGLGNVIIEAMACDIPVISYDCLAGPRELIEPKSNFFDRTTNYEWKSCGILVEPCNNDTNFNDTFEKSDENLCDAMISAYKNRDKLNKCRLNANERIKEFMPENILKEWKEVI